MGCCESKNSDNDSNFQKIRIDRMNKNYSQTKIQNEIEAILPGNPPPINSENLDLIVKQKEKSICKIMKNEIPQGTGFLCNISGHSKKRKALITAYHVVGEEDLKIGNNIKITFDDNNKEIKIIKIDKKRYIYASEEYDITIIEVIDTDNLKNYNYLEIDENIYNDIDFNKNYNNQNIYILHYPKGLLSSFSDNIFIKIDEDDIIYHLCSTEHGSSGAPILSLDTFKVIGIHLGNGNFNIDLFTNERNLKQLIYNKDNKVLCNYGRIITKPLYIFNNKDNKIILTLKIDKYDKGKKIYFLQNYETIMNIKINSTDDFLFYNGKLKDLIKDIENYRLNIKNFVILINDKKYESKNYFIPIEEGTYIITIFINSFMKDCFGLFFCCRNILNIDLSSFYTNNVTNMKYMFYECSQLKHIDLSSFDTKKVTDMSHMFHYCRCLNYFDFFGKLMGENN